MGTTLPIWDQRMFILMKYCIDNKIDGIKNQANFMARVEILGTATMKQIRDGSQSFRHIHIQNACKLTGASVDWVYGLSTRMNRLEIKSNPLALLKEATRLIESELKQKTAVNKTVNKKAIKKKKTA